MACAMPVPASTAARLCRTLVSEASVMFTFWNWPPR